MKYRIVVDPDLCIGAASCATLAPLAFVMNGENKAEVLDHGNDHGIPSFSREVDLSEDELETVIMGAQSCPTMAIEIFDAEGTRLYP